MMRTGAIVLLSWRYRLNGDVRDSSAGAGRAASDTPSSAVRRHTYRFGVVAAGRPAGVERGPEHDAGHPAGDQAVRQHGGDADSEPRRDEQRHYADGGRVAREGHLHRINHARSPMPILK